jgi:hypothetical protein
MAPPGWGWAGPKVGCTRSHTGARQVSHVRLSMSRDQLIRRDRKAPPSPAGLPCRRMTYAAVSPPPLSSSRLMRSSHSFMTTFSFQPAACRREGDRLIEAVFSSSIRAPSRVISRLFYPPRWYRRTRLRPNAAAAESGFSQRHSLTAASLSRRIRSERRRLSHFVGFSEMLTDLTPVPLLSRASWCRCRAAEIL